MKIGIVTWYKNYNYGGTLQAFALKTILESIGVEVEFINYDGEDSNMKKKTIRIFRNMAFSILYPNRAATRRKMKKFIQMNIPETKHFNSFFDVDNYVDKEFDAVIAGSDQIWNSIKGYNKFYYLDFSSDVPKIAYAPSMEKIDESKKEFWEAVVFSLNKYSALSVRESVIKEFLESNLKKEVKVVVDPTLLLNCKEWFNALDVKDCNCSKSIFANEEYICVYMITYNEEYFNQINIFAKKTISKYCI